MIAQLNISYNDIDIKKIYFFVNCVFSLHRLKNVQLFLFFSLQISL